MAERQLPKLNVAGSIPVSRSNSSLPAQQNLPIPEAHYCSYCPDIENGSKRRSPALNHAGGLVNYWV
ncbi:MAG: hypothetical protein JWQ42_2191 [Edaphobacter sp.]|nr:hypothetical protein [Edaphobacter sp.]